MLKRAFYRFRGVTTEAAAALWAYERRYSLRFNRREGVNDDIFDPVGMVTSNGSDTCTNRCVPSTGILRFPVVPVDCCSSGNSSNNKNSLMVPYLG